jgi:addiction module HigA family antidote
MSEATDYATTGPGKRAPTHPGEVLREHVLPALGISVTKLADALGVSRQALYKVLAGRSGVTPEMALRLGAFLGNGPGLWLRMQQTHDLWAARRALGEKRLRHIAKEAEKLERHNESA